MSILSTKMSLLEERGCLRKSETYFEFLFDGIPYTGTSNNKKD